MKIAILSSGDLAEMKGIMNYVHEKAKHIKSVSGSEKIECDVYIIRQVTTTLFRLLTSHSFTKSFRTLKQEDTTIYDNVIYHNLWHSYGVLSNIVDTKYRKIPLNNKNISKFSKLLKSYDIIASHTLEGHYLAYKTKLTYNVPFVATWHGSDINVDPYKNKVAEAFTSTILANADMNLFVSKALLEASQKLSNTKNKDVIYTGPADLFKRATDSDIQKYRKQNGADCQQIIIGFTGNLIGIKNVLIIPEILKKVNEKLNNQFKVTFWIAGNGNLQSQLEDELKQNNIDYKFFGKLMPYDIPMFMSCLQILLLPSLNEGLPLVTLEAKKCGVNVVASNVGGIKECIGIENCFDLGEDFSNNMADRIIEIITTKEKPTPLEKEFSWDSAIEKEINYYKQILNNTKNGE